MPYSNDSNALMQALNLLLLANVEIEANRGDNPKSFLQQKIENFIVKQNESKYDFRTDHNF